jgi:hypothetical protein
VQSTVIFVMQSLMAQKALIEKQLNLRFEGAAHRDII